MMLENTDINKIKKNIEDACNPKIIELKQLTLQDLNKIQKNEQINILHTYIPDLTIKIRIGYMIDNILGIPTVFYTNGLTIEDTLDRIYPRHKVELDNNALADYITLLLKCTTKSAYTYTRVMQEKNLKLNDIIEFSGGSKGIVCLPPTDYNIKNIMYIPLKKDGTISKNKPRMLYSNTIYTRISQKNTKKDFSK